MGSKSVVKKISRKAILDVDVAKACETIEKPAAPMALRLQGSLLYGVARVYSQQCGYVLNDVEQARNGMRAIFSILRAGELDAEGVHKARGDQLVLPDDPAFVPDLVLADLDLNENRLDELANIDSQGSNLSPRSSKLSGSHDTPLGIDIPASASSWYGGPVGGFGSVGGSGVGRREERTILEDDLGLQVADDGALIFNDEPATLQCGSSLKSNKMGSRTMPPPLPPRNAGSDAAPIHDQFYQTVDDDPNNLQYEGDLQVAPVSDSAYQGDESATRQIYVETTSETVDAPMRRRKKPASRVLPLDHTTELRNSDLARWNTDYLANMAQELQHKHNHQAPALARKNAESWMLQQSDRGPLNMFTGARLLKALTGVDLLAAPARKRAAQDELSSDSAKRARRGARPDEVGRGEDTQMNEDDAYHPNMDDTVERGRDQPTPLDDRPPSGIFPWNQSTGSRRPTAAFGSQTGAQYLSSISGGGAHGGLVSRRTSRLTSQSPLLGRSMPLPEDDADDFQLPALDNADITAEEAFELYGAAANVDTQTAAQSQWVRSALDAESINFLAFVKEAIAEADEQVEEHPEIDGSQASGRGSIDFGTLLPPENNSKVVAAQALLHVLTLGTKRLIDAQQSRAFETITLQLAA